MAYDPGRSPGWLSDRRTKAAAVVSGVVLAAVASEVDTPQALALPSEAYAAQLEQAAERNPIIEKMNKKLIALWAELQRLKKEHKKGIYRREYKAKGQTYIALSASERVKNQAAGEVSYNHFVMLAKLGAKLPESCLLYAGASQAEPLPGEQYKGVAILERKVGPRGGYFLEFRTKTGNGMIVENFMIGQKSPSGKDYQKMDTLFTSYADEGRRIISQVTQTK